MHNAKTLHPIAFNFVMSVHLVMGCLLATYAITYGMTRTFDGPFELYFSICILIMGMGMSNSTVSNPTTSLGFATVIAIVSGVFLPMLVQREVLSFLEIRTCLYLMAATLACIGISGTVLPKAYYRLQDTFFISTMLILPIVILFENTSLWMRVGAALAAYYLAFTMHMHVERRPKTLNRALRTGPKVYLIVFDGISFAFRKMGFRPVVIHDKNHM